MTNSPPSSSSGATRSRAFEHLHERVRRWVWDQGWTDLRDVQEAAIAAVYASDADLILAAATASGKTEAAFLPICSRLVDAAGGSVRVLYISPLKALINDQFERLDRLCEHLEIPVHRWHGDVSASAKQRLVRQPSGVLLITPESLEAMFVVHGSRLGTIFRELDYVVVDELHAFLGSERGRQLQSLLHRLEVMTQHRIRRIGLSATLGDMRLAAEFLRPAGRDAVQLLVSTSGGQELRMQVRGYLVRPPIVRPPHDGELPEEEDEADGSTQAIAEHLFTTLRGTNNLIFANRRQDVEKYADILRRHCEGAHVPTEFWPHHGSLGRDVRHDVEAMLRDHTRPVSVVCTSTLEMGIDIGSVASVAQIGPPPSVASLRQRLGRSGRRGSAAVLRVYVQEAEITERTAPHECLREDLVQSIAMVQLLLARWCEPPAAGSFHFSTLVQQVLSLIAQYGGIVPVDAWRVLCKTGPFGAVDSTAFAEFLRGLAQHQLLVQASDGTLLLGPAGERLVEHYSFFAAFGAPEEYRLVADGRALGSLPISQPVGEGMFLVFAGRRWRIVHVDSERKVIDLTAAAAGRLPHFESSHGPAVHERVRQEMRAILCGTDVPVFLDVAARGLLAEGRDHFRRLSLAERTIVPCGQETLLFPWAGSQAMNTMVLQLMGRGLDASAEGVAIVVAAHEAVVREALVALGAAGPANADELAARAENLETEKHDSFVPEALLRREFAMRTLDPAGAWRAVQRLAEQTGVGGGRDESK